VHAFRHLQKSLITLLIVVCANHPRSAAVHFLALEWSRALNEVCKIPEALHPTHDSHIGLRSGKLSGRSSFAMLKVKIIVKSENLLGDCT